MIQVRQCTYHGIKGYKICGRANGDDAGYWPVSIFEPDRGYADKIAKLAKHPSPENDDMIDNLLTRRAMI